MTSSTIGEGIREGEIQVISRQRQTYTYAPLSQSLLSLSFVWIMSVLPFSSETFLTFIPSRNQWQLKQIYSEIPTTLVTFLKQRNVVQIIDFSRKVQMSDEAIGNEFNKQWNSFINHVQRSIKEVFREKGVTCIDPYELAKDISNRYLKQQPKWVRRNHWCSARFSFSQTYTMHDGDIQVSRADVDVEAYVKEECEDNCVDANMCLVSFDIKLTIKALSIDAHKIRVIGQLLDEQGTAKAIEYMRANT